MAVNEPDEVIFKHTASAVQRQCAGYEEYLVETARLALMASIIPSSSRAHHSIRPDVEAYEIPPAVYRLYGQAALDVYTRMHNGHSMLGKELDQHIAGKQSVEPNRRKLIDRMKDWMGSAYLDAMMYNSAPGAPKLPEILPVETGDCIARFNTENFIELIEKKRENRCPDAVWSA